MINSPEVHFNITKGYPEVGLKNNYILSYKNHIGADLTISQDNLYKNIPSITLCNFWHRS
jgi:hypothetical protein